jgi:hypothetical protein
LLNGYAEYLVNYERALAGGARGFTVQFQKRFNEIMAQDQFTSSGFKNLMDEQTRSLRSGAISLAPGADAKSLNAMALDQKQRAEDDVAVRGLSGGKKPSTTSSDANHRLKRLLQQEHQEMLLLKNTKN